MITNRLHAPSPEGTWLMVPLLRYEYFTPVIAGTWYAPEPIRLHEFVIGLSDADVDRIIATINNRSQRVWVLDRARLQYSATLIELPDNVAESCGLHLQIRTSPYGEILGRNEVCVADEILAERWLRERNITRQWRDGLSPTPVLPLHDAWHVAADRRRVDHAQNISAYPAYRVAPKLDL